MHKYKYKMDGIWHTIHSQEPLSCNECNIIPISASQNQTAKELKELLREWIRVTEANGIAWFAIGGTALGSVRQKGFIWHDYDIDLCVWLKDFQKVKNLVFDKKYKIELCNGHGFSFQFADRDFPFFDVFVVGPNPSNPTRIIHATPITACGKALWFDSLIWPKDNYSVYDVIYPDKSEYEGILINVPRNVEMYLKQMYGDDCMTKYYDKTA